MKNKLEMERTVRRLFYLRERDNKTWSKTMGTGNEETIRKVLGHLWFIWMCMCVLGGGEIE